jgi:hypothetical protein
MLNWALVITDASFVYGIVSHEPSQTFGHDCWRNIAISLIDPARPNLN